MRPTINIRNEADKSREGLITQYSKLTVVLNWNAASRWTLEIPVSWLVTNPFDPSKGIIIERNGRTLLSGPVDTIKQSFQGRQLMLTVAGPDDTGWLDNRLVLPSAYPYTASAYDVKTDEAETAMHYYVNKNLGSLADALRQLPGLEIASDWAKGTIVTGRGRFQTVMAMNRELALKGGDLRFQILQVGEHLEFQVFEPADLSGRVVFSLERGNLSTFDYQRQAPEANYVIVGGSGVGTSRVFREDGDDASVSEWGGTRREMFRDRRDTSVTAELEESITEELADKSENTSLGLTTINTRAAQFGRDYNFGDRVKVITPLGDEIVEAIRTLTITWEGDKPENVEPTVGFPGTTHPRVPAIYKDRAYIEKRTEDLEHQ